MPTFAPPPLDPRLLALLTDYPRELFTERFYRGVELADRYGLDIAIKLLRELGVAHHLDRWRSVGEISATLGFHSRFRVALGWLLERLVEPGLVEAVENAGTRCYQLTGPLRQAELDELRAMGLALDPANAATLDLLDAAAAIYPAVASGTSVDEAMFGMERIGLWLAFFRNDNPLYAINNWVGAYAAARCLADHPGLRILEIGAGAGSAATALLSVLAEKGLTKRIERYLVTEPNAFFRRRAERELKARYRDLPLEFGALDVNKPWAGQGAAIGQFDLVFGVNVLHVARDLPFSLGQARASLAAGGWLVLGECLRPFPGQPVYAELMFQILDSFLDVALDPEFRPNPGFLTPEQWLKALARAGFGHTEALPDPARIRPLYRRFFTGALCATG